MLLGAHTGGSPLNIESLYNRAQYLNAEVIQFFLGSPTRWYLDTDKFISTNINFNDSKYKGNVFVHSHFLINLFSLNNYIVGKSFKLLYDLVKIAVSMNIRGVIVHTGSRANSSKEEVYSYMKERVLPGIVEICNIIPDDSDTELIFEHTSSQGNTICNTVEDIIDYMSLLGKDKKISVCLDTCHLFATGYELDKKGEIFRIIDKILNSNISISAIHLNDSKKECGSHLDRHESIGDGKIGLDFFEDIVNANYNIPLILETPINGQKKDMDMLRSLIK